MPKVISLQNIDLSNQKETITRKRKEQVSFDETISPPLLINEKNISDFTFPDILDKISIANNIPLIPISANNKTSISSDTSVSNTFEIQKDITPISELPIDPINQIQPIQDHLPNDQLNIKYFNDNYAEIQNVKPDATPSLSEQNENSDELLHSEPDTLLSTPQYIIQEEYNEIGLNIGTTTYTEQNINADEILQSDTDDNLLPNLDTNQKENIESDTTFGTLSYHPPSQPSKKNRKARVENQNPRTESKSNINLRIRLRLVFVRGAIELSLIPDRQQGLQNELVVRDTKGKVCLTEMNEEFYEPIPLIGHSNDLQYGIKWQYQTNGDNYFWILSGRPIFVLGPGDEFGLSGFISIPQLWLNTRHAVLCIESLRMVVLDALQTAGCNNFEVKDDQSPGVPSGWLLIRDVKPTKHVPRRIGQDILNVLCPGHEIEPHFSGGIKLERNVYLKGYPPQIRLSGDIENNFDVLIDNQPIQSLPNGSMYVPGWDTIGEHRLWFGDRVVTYSIRTIEEGWSIWDARSGVDGTSICGANISLSNSTFCQQVRVPQTNPLIIGAQPGEIYRCSRSQYVYSDTIIALVPFSPVWALPIDPIHVHKRSNCIILLQLIPPKTKRSQNETKPINVQAIQDWVTSVRDAGRKHLEFKIDLPESKILWREYNILAKQLWRKMR
jgi:hypothetical protein